VYKRIETFNEKKSTDPVQPKILYIYGLLNLFKYIVMSMTKHKCPECGSAMNGRVDKKYCSDICRTAFHNRNRVTGNDYVRSVNHILLRNRRILMENASDDARPPRLNFVELQTRGFDFNYYTHCRNDQNGNVRVFCYDYGYLRTNDDELKVVYKDE